MVRAKIAVWELVVPLSVIKPNNLLLSKDIVSLGAKSGAAKIAACVKLGPILPPLRI
jgi:hypothetical protein